MQLMKTLVISLIIALCALFFMRAAPAEVVSIWDENLRAVILKKLNKPNPKATITTSDMLQLTELRLEDVNFSIFISLCSVVFFFTTLVSYSKENATEKIPSESLQAPIEGVVPERMVLIPAGEFVMGSNYKVANWGPCSIPMICSIMKSRYTPSTLTRSIWINTR